jgi:hypothetical protein
VQWATWWVAYPTGSAATCARAADRRVAWARAHETVYQQSMKAFDDYVNGEEFQRLKRESQELRDKKKY